MEMGQNVYVVEAENHAPRLIEAALSTQALAYAARTTYKVRKASQKDLIALLPTTKVESVREEPQADPQDSLLDVTVDPAGHVVPLAA
jgi:hypothetical protein